MRIRVRENSGRVVYIELGTSCSMWIQTSGLRLNNTVYPQHGIDYDESGSKVKIIGIDGI